MRRIRIIHVVAVLAAIAALAPSAGAETECKAEVRATAKTDQVSDEAITKVFAVEVDAPEDCGQGLRGLRRHGAAVQRRGDHGSSLVPGGSS